MPAREIPLLNQLRLKTREFAAGDRARCLELMKVSKLVGDTESDHTPRPIAGCGRLLRIARGKTSLG
jgi:hypothetical protein